MRRVSIGSPPFGGGPRDPAIQWLIDAVNELANASFADTREDIEGQAGATYQPLDADLSALAANSANGLWARTGDGTGAARTIAGTAPIGVTNGDGVAGNPTIALTRYDSGDQTITSAGALTLAHGLGAIPKSVQVWLHCTTADLNHSVGNFLLVSGAADFDGTNSKGVSVVPDATNLNIRFGSTASAFTILNKTTGAAGSITNSSWRAVFRAFV